MKKKYAFVSISAAFGILVSILLCEAFVRTFPPAWLQHRMTTLNPDASAAGFGSDRAWKVERRDGKFLRFKPGTKFDVSHYEYANVAHIDDLGGRRVAHNREAQVEVPNLIVPFLGDSFTFGVGVEDEETFASLLSSKLGGVRIVNLGVPGTAIHNQLDIIRLRYAEFGRPSRVVFFFFLGNDFANIRNAVRSDETELNRKPLGQTVANKSSPNFLSHINGFVYHNTVLKQSYLIQFLRKFALEFYIADRKRQNKKFVGDPIFIIMNQDDERQYLEATKDLVGQFKRLKAMEKELGFSSLLITIPDVHQIDETKRKLQAAVYGIAFRSLDSNRPNRLVEMAASKENLLFFDSTHCLSSSGLGAKLYYTQDNHLRAIGHELLANCIEERLKLFVQGL